ncbi:molybdopterin molybdotransferase MoeA [Glaciibacter flavus]|uniref:molybdopterin molybdotransferase MoeA n=1 Tax=Orlajensenia flava TaxID=2565934 RepID=UPI003B005DC3
MTAPAMITVEEHLAHVLDTVAPLPSQTLPLAEALGATLGEDAAGRHDIPVFDNSGMDGYAVRGVDVATASTSSPMTLRVVADIPAGSPEDPPLAPGEAARIMTGAPLPTDADAIVPVEQTVGGGWSDSPEVVVLDAPLPGAHVRRAAADLAEGDTVLSAGERLTPRHLAAAAAAGITELVVRRAPRVAIISTGTELVAPGRPLARGQIPESNSVLLAGLVAETDARVASVETVPDDADALRAALGRAEHIADLVVLSGGVSVGAYDVVKEVLAGTVDTVSVAMQPGKPQAFGVLAGGTPVFGLPGNPVSVAVSFEVFVRPALLRMLGRDRVIRPEQDAIVAMGWRTPPGRRQYMPVAIDHTDGALSISPATRGGSGSHLAGGLARAHGYAVVAADVDEVRPGDVLPVMLV